LELNNVKSFKNKKNVNNKEQYHYEIKIYLSQLFLY